MQTKINKSIVLAILALLIFSFQSCGFDVNAIKGNGNIVNVDKQLGEFNVINASGMFRIVLEQGGTPGVRIETDENLQEYITAEVRNNTLELSMTRGNTYNPTRLIVYVSIDALRKLELSGATSLSADDPIVGDELVLRLSGAGEIDIKVEVDALETSVSGAGSIKIEGEARKHNLMLSGASSVKCLELITQQTRIVLSGAGSADIYASEMIDASLSGVGSIRYGGNPPQTNINKTGLGSIKAL